MTEATRVAAIQMNEHAGFAVTHAAGPRSRNRNGVRPSSGAAMFALRNAWEISDALGCANAAAPEDGRMCLAC